MRKLKNMQKGIEAIQKQIDAYASPPGQECTLETVAVV